MTDLEFEVRSGGHRLGGFEGGEVTQSLDALAASFTFQWESRALQGGGRLDLQAAAPVEIFAAGTRLLTGYVTSDRAQYEATKEGAAKEALSLTGSSRLIDLVDCSAASATRRFRSVSLPDIAATLAEPYGVPVVVSGDFSQPFRRVTIDAGERIGDVLQRLARDRGAVLVDVEGTLVITRAGNESAGALRYGQSRIISGSRSRDHRQRFREYAFPGQRRATDTDSGVETHHLVIETDEGVSRFRRLAIIAASDSRADVQKRAIVTRNTRAGRSERVNYTLGGWHDSTGELWRPNRVVTVTDPVLGLETESLMIVTSSRYARPQVRRTSRERTRPEAFDAVRTFPVRAIGGRP